MLRSSLCGLLWLVAASPLLAQAFTSTPASGSTAASVSFLQQQLEFPRVRAAQAATGPKVAGRLRAFSLDPRRLEIFLRLIKTNPKLEVWACNQGAGPFALLHSYPLAATSGTLGPKRLAGDEQVPEGFYEIDRFHPKSYYHLSLGLNYPNAADRALGEPNPGGDIFIHGSNVSIGCVPITDAGIEEVYLLAVLARNAGQPVIPVHIFPFPLTSAELAKRADSPHAGFWRGLQAGYADFEQRHELPATTQVAGSGR